MVPSFMGAISLNQVVAATDPLNTEMGRIYAMGEVPRNHPR